eukprot:scaffold607954_cov19-Prasinocladus_malaysianus.AAC.1
MGIEVRVRLHCSCGRPGQGLAVGNQSNKYHLFLQEYSYSYGYPNRMLRDITRYDLRYDLPPLQGTVRTSTRTSSAAPLLLYGIVSIRSRTMCTT